MEWRGQVGRQLPPARDAGALRALSQRFVEGGDGHWRLREGGGLLASDRGESADVADARASAALRLCYYVVFDLEGTDLDAGKPMQWSSPCH